MKKHEWFVFSNIFLILTHEEKKNKKKNEKKNRFPEVLVTFAVEKKNGIMSARLTRSSIGCRIKKSTEIRTCLVRNLNQHLIAILKSVVQRN